MLTRFYEISELDEQGQPAGEWGKWLRGACFARGSHRQEIRSNIGLTS